MIYCVHKNACHSIIFQCDKFACVGVEVFFVMAGTSDSSVSSQGSQKGMDFLTQRTDILKDFAQFFKGTGQV